MHERALVIRESRLGPDHPDTAESLNGLARVLIRLGGVDNGRALHERALTIFEARLGSDHPDTLQTREHLAAIRAKVEGQ